MTNIQQFTFIGTSQYANKNSPQRAMHAQARKNSGSGKH